MDTLSKTATIVLTSMIMTACGGSGSNDGSTDDITSGDQDGSLKTSTEVAQEIAMVNGMIEQGAMVYPDELTTIAAASNGLDSNVEKTQSAVEKINHEITLPCPSGGNQTYAVGENEYDFQYFPAASDFDISYGAITADECVSVLQDLDSVSGYDLGVVTTTITVDGTLAAGYDSSYDSFDAAGFGFITFGDTNGTSYHQEVTEVSNTDDSTVYEGTIDWLMQLEVEQTDRVSTTLFWSELFTSHKFYNSAGAYTDFDLNIIYGSQTEPMQYQRDSNTGTVSLQGSYSYSVGDCTIERTVDTSLPLLLDAEDEFTNGSLVVSSSVDSVVIEFNGDGSASVELTDGSTIVVTAEEIRAAKRNPPRCNQ